MLAAEIDKHPVARQVVRSEQLSSTDAQLNGSSTNFTWLEHSSHIAQTNLSLNWPPRGLYDELVNQSLTAFSHFKLAILNNHSIPLAGTKARIVQHWYHSPH